MNNIKVLDADRVEIDGRVFVAEKVVDKWVPDDGDKYYMPCVYDIEPNEDFWAELSYELDYMKRGLVCRTKEEAIEKAKRMLKALEVE